MAAKKPSTAGTASTTSKTKKPIVVASKRLLTPVTPPVPLSLQKTGNQRVSNLEIIDALTLSYGIIIDAAKMLGVSHVAIIKRIKKNKKLQEALDEIRYLTDAHAERIIILNLRMGDPKIAMWYKDHRLRVEVAELRKQEAAIRMKELSKEGETTDTGGVLVVPMVQSSDEWEAAASALSTKQHTEIP